MAELEKTQQALAHVRQDAQGQWHEHSLAEHLNEVARQAGETAQALCLEEMTGKAVPKGAIFHHTSRRRREVAITPELRQQVAETVAAIRAMLDSGTLPPPVNDQRCKECSLKEICQPEALAERRRQRALRAELFNDLG